MNKPLLLSELQKPCAIPSRIQKNLREKIMHSDFLVADDKGTHRMIGLKFCKKTDSAPAITCVCMRHEMPYAKQISFSLGKKIFYSSNVSGKLFKYAVGDFLMPDIFTDVAIFYADFFNIKKKNLERNGNDIYVSAQGVRIKGHTLKPFFKLDELVSLIGEPDEKHWMYPNEKFNEICSWEELGIRTFACGTDRQHIYRLLICQKECPGQKLMPFLGDLYINGKLFYGGAEDGIYNYYELGRNAFHIVPLNADYGYCSIDKAAYVAVDFWKAIYFAYAYGQTEHFQKLIKKGHNINYTAGWNKEPLLTIAITDSRPELVRLLIEAGADVNKPSRWGKTPLMRAVVRGEAQYVRLLLEAGADLDLRDDNGLSAVDHARLYKVGDEIIEMLNCASVKN